MIASDVVCCLCLLFALCLLCVCVYASCVCLVCLCLASVRRVVGLCVVCNICV